MAVIHKELFTVVRNLININGEHRHVTLKNVVINNSLHIVVTARLCDYNETCIPNDKLSHSCQMSSQLSRGPANNMSRIIRENMCFNRENPYRVIGMYLCTKPNTRRVSSEIPTFHIALIAFVET